MVFLYCILFLAVCEFSFSEGNKLPDDGRLMVGRCLDKLFRGDRNPTRRIESYLFDLCKNTKNNYNHIVNCIDDKLTKNMGIGPSEAFDRLKVCLDKSADTLIKRYKGFAFKSGNFKTEEEFKKYPEIAQVVNGLCADQEWVKYEDLDREEQKKSLECFRGCTVNLFEVFEQNMKNMEKQYRNHLRSIDMQDAKKLANEKGETSEKPLDQIEAKEEQSNDDEAYRPSEDKVINQEQQDENSDDTEDDESDDKTSQHDKKESGAKNPEEEHETQNKIYEDQLGWLDNLKKLLHISQEQYVYKKGIDNYEKTCEESTVQGISTMTDIGKLWGKHYVEDIINFYDKFHYTPIKFRVRSALQTYLYCARWKCAMGDYRDIPLQDWVINLRSNIRV